MESPPSRNNPPRDWPRLAALAALTLAGVLLCYLLLAPFLPAVTWAVALTVVALPLHRLIERVVRSRNVAAGVSTGVVVLVIALPVTAVAAQMANETRKAAVRVQEERNHDDWRQYVARVPWAGEYLSHLDPVEVELRAREMITEIVGSSFGVVRGVGEVAFQALAAVIVLFFLLRDHRELLAQTRGYLPLPPEAAARVLQRAADAIHATVYGSVVTAVLQGTTGGLMFWVLGLPAPVLWGVVMTVLGILPFVGAFFVWVPAAVFLALEERWLAAILLVAWGLAMVGPVCNWVYAVTAGDRMRMHPVPTLLAFVGGLVVFGVSGMILGPCILAVTVALLGAWRRPTADAPAATLIRPAGATLNGK